MASTTLGVIAGNRGFFPKHLCVSGRETILMVLESEGIRAIALDLDESPYGSLESLADAHRCADLFKRNRDSIDGVLVTLPNFGDERAIANALRWAGLNVPVLVHAFPDDPTQMTIANRRDSFCGKMSACNNLRQYGIPTESLVKMAKFGAVVDPGPASSSSRPPPSRAGPPWRSIMGWCPAP